MSKYRLFNMSVLQAKPQPGQAEGNFYVAGTLENQECVFEENTNIVMFGVDGLIRNILKIPVASDLTTENLCLT